MFLLLGALAVYRFMPPTICPFHSITGIPCLTCGAMRAAESFFAGDLVGMFLYNPLVVTFCGGLFFFSLFKLLEFIFGFELKVDVNRRFTLAARALAITLIAANWLFLIVAGR
jgi:hypothetical protein